MESLLWALNLMAVVYLCFWAVGKDKLKAKEKREGERDHA